MNRRNAALRFALDLDAGPRSRNGFVDTYAPRESEVLPAVREALRLHPAVSRVFRVNSGAHFSADESHRFIRYHDVDGMSDLWVWLKPPYAPLQAFVEVKRPGGRLSDNQRAFLEGASAHGHIAIVTASGSEAYASLQRALARIDAARGKAA